jgi:hypothetical protein
MPINWPKVNLILTQTVTETATKVDADVEALLKSAMRATPVRARVRRIADAEVANDYKRLR